MILGFIPITFRFRGKLKRLAEIYQCFLDNPKTGLHPAQISRQTGYSLAEVSNRLESTPELFVRLPKRDGLTRYRLTSATAVRSPEEVGKLLIASARRESLLLYAVGTMVFFILLIVVILVAPTFEQPEL